MKNVFSEGDVQFPVFVDVGNNDNYCPLNYTYVYINEGHEEGWGKGGPNLDKIPVPVASSVETPAPYTCDSRCTHATNSRYTHSREQDWHSGESIHLPST